MSLMYVGLIIMNVFSIILYICDYISGMWKCLIRNGDR